MKLGAVRCVLTWQHPSGSASRGRWFWNYTGWTGTGIRDWNESGKCWPAPCCCRDLNGKSTRQRRNVAQVGSVKSQIGMNNWDSIQFKNTLFAPRGQFQLYIFWSCVVADIVRCPDGCWGAAGLRRQPGAFQCRPRWCPRPDWFLLQIGGALHLIIGQKRQARRRRKPPVPKNDEPSETASIYSTKLHRTAVAHLSIKS